MCQDACRCEVFGCVWFKFFLWSLLEDFSSVYQICITGRNKLFFQNSLIGFSSNCSIDFAILRCGLLTWFPGEFKASFA